MAVSVTTTERLAFRIEGSGRITGNPEITDQRIPETTFKNEDTSSLQRNFALRPGAFLFPCSVVPLVAAF